MASKKSSKKRRVWSWRSLVSYHLLFTSIIILISGVALYVAPPGRIAHSTDWRLLGYNKDQWAAIHTVLSFTATGFAVWHLVLNWKALLCYLKDRIRRAYRLKAEFVVALLLTLIIWMGSALHLPPFNVVMDWGDEFRGMWEQVAIPPASLVEEGKAEEYKNEGRNGRGRLTVQDLCRQQGIPVSEGLAHLAAYKLNADAATRIRYLADSSGYTPSDVTNIVLGYPLQK